MPDPEQILAAAESADADPPRSKLDPFAEALWTLRRKRKRLRAITAFLREHGVEVSKSTVSRWLKRHPQPRPAPDASTNAAPSQLLAAASRAPASSGGRQRAKTFFNSTSDNEPL